MLPLYYACTYTMKALLLLLSHWEVRGQNNAPRRGALILASNHCSYVDPPLLSASIPRIVCFMAKEDLFRSLLLRLLVTGYGAFPVRRETWDRQALRQAISLLERGRVIGMFPEGKRSPDGRLGKGQTGAALLALRTGVPILPVGIAGTERIVRKRDVFSRPHITVTIGEPFSLSAKSGRVTSAELAHYTSWIMGRIAQLLPESQRGAYSQIREASLA